MTACDEHTDMIMKGKSPECEWLKHDENAKHVIMRVSHIKVALKFCGHCSPRRDMAILAEELMAAAEEISFVFFSRDPSADVLIILNACEAACAAQPPFPGPVIIITPETVNRWPLNGNGLAEEILKVLKTSVKPE